MDHLLLTRRQMLKAAGAAGLVSAASVVLPPIGSFAEDDEDALGPFGPWPRPVRLAERASDANDFHPANVNDFHPAISDDGLSLYFTSDRPPGASGKEQIWVSRRSSLTAPWGRPENLGLPINLPGYASAVPNLARHGHLLFFHSTRPGGYAPPGKADIWVSFRADPYDDFSWEEPTNIGRAVNTLGAAGPSYFRDPDAGRPRLYFNRMIGPGIGGFGTNVHAEIFVSVMGPDHQFGEGRQVVPWAAPPYRNTRTAIRRDGLEMLLTSNRPGGSVYDPGQLVEKIWVSTRVNTASDDIWSKPALPEDLDGSTLNSRFGDGGPALSADGTTLYFFSQRALTASGKPGKRQLWTSQRERLKDGDRQGRNHE